MKQEKMDWEGKKCFASFGLKDTPSSIFLDKTTCCFFTI